MTQASVNVDDQDNVFVAYVRSTHPMMSASSIVQGDHVSNGQIPANSRTIQRRWSSAVISAQHRDSR